MNQTGEDEREPFRRAIEAMHHVRDKLKHDTGPSYDLAINLVIAKVREDARRRAVPPASLALRCAQELQAGEMFAVFISAALTMIENDTDAEDMQ